jgi:hypothetical protein
MKVVQAIRQLRAAQQTDKRTEKTSGLFWQKRAVSERHLRAPLLARSSFMLLQGELAMLKLSSLSSYPGAAHLSLASANNDFQPEQPQLNACDVRAGSRWESARAIYIFRQLEIATLIHSNLNEGRAKSSE